MISVIIPTLNPDKRFAISLSSLVPGVVRGLIKEVIVVDGGSTDDLVAGVCDAAGARLISADTGRGTQMVAGAEEAKGEWLLFLHADTVLESGWDSEVSDFIEKIEVGDCSPRAGALQFALDDFGTMPRILETLVAMRCAIFKLPYGDQALLISRSLYNEIGGYKKIPLMEDVDIVRRLGRRRLIMLRSKAITSSIRFQKDGYLFRMMKNVTCLFLFYLRVPPHIIQKLYG